MKITINDVAKACGVNVSTVSRVLNNDSRISTETVEKVNKAVQELGYKPLRRRKKSSQEIILAIPNTGIYTIGATLDFLSNRLKEKDFDIRIMNLKRTRDITVQIAESICTKNPAGVILYGCYVSKEAAKVFEKHKIPAIVRHGETQHMISVCVNNYNGIQEAMKFAIGRGYKKFGFVGWNPSDHNVHTRQNSFLNALRDADIDDYHIVGYELNGIGGYKSTQELLQTFNPDIIIYAADILAYGGIEYLNEKGISYPDDIGIIGFDDSIPSAALGLTTMDELLEETAELVMDNLLSMIENKSFPPPREVLLTPRLVVRRSTK